MTIQLRAMLAIFVAASLVSAPATAAAPTLSTQNAVEAVEAPAPDPYGRETPRGLASGLLSALAAEDYARAAQFLNLSPLPEERRATSGPALARRLQQLLDRGGSLTPFSALPNNAGGVVNDGLPVDQERIGAFRSQAGEVPLIARRIEAIGRTPYWVVSSDSLRAMPAEAETPTKSGLSDELPEVLTETKLAGAPLLDWLILAALAAISFGLFRFLFALALRGARRLVANPDENRLYRFAVAASPPLGLYVAVIAFFLTTQSLEIAIVARQVMGRYITIVAWVAFVWFLWRLIDAIAEVWRRRMSRRDRRQAMAATLFVRRAAKAVLAIIAFVAVLDTIGIDVTTGIAALGLGGLALALGAQKTIENLVGGVTVIVDQPARVGDFCTVGEVSGTIEDIGMRSTRLRTNARTVVTIPNGAFSSAQIENFSRRDRFLFHQTIGVSYATDANVMKQVLGALREIIRTSDRIFDDEARVRFHGFGDSALNIEIFTYFRASSYPESLALQEDLLLAIMRELAELGVEIAFPTRTVIVRRERGE